jgi:UDP-N-acetylmuramoylalanine--D-glutamate ligase
MKDLLNKTYSRKHIGIWGCGVAGASVTRYFLEQSVTITVFEKRELTDQEISYFSSHGIKHASTTELEIFLQEADYIFPSPGIDLRPYQQYAHKWLNELDLFAQEWKKPIIAITGTVGKTSLTTLLSSILDYYGFTVATGGNIGVGLLDLLDQQESADYALLELSSYQLERSLYCAPDLAIITNIYPNHLDRHGSFAQYCAAKYRILEHQHQGQAALIPYAYLQDIRAFIQQSHPEKPQRNFLLCADTLPENYQQELLPGDSLFTQDIQGNILAADIHKTTVLIPHAQIPTISFAANWILICAALHALGLDFHAALTAPLALPAHRGELVALKKGVSYYNDSKSTLFEATLAAVERLQPAPIILLLGGVSKGVDRIARLPELAGKVAHVLCFGAEAHELAKACSAAQIPASAYPNLEEAFASSLKLVSDTYAVLFSPAGASFDLFKNYQERGNRFVELVNQL